MAEEEELLLEKLTPCPVVEIHGDLGHVQGIAVSDQSIWITSVHRENKTGDLQKYDRKTGEFLCKVFVQDDNRYHPGGIALAGDLIWLPVATYSREGSAVIECRDKDTLELRNQFRVEDHIGCVAVSEDQIIGGNWDTRIIYIWDPKGNLLTKIENPRNTAYQDMKWVDGCLVASGLSEGRGVVDWLSLPALDLQKRIIGGKNDRGVNYMSEGMAIYSGRLFLLPEDGPQSRLFSYKLSLKDERPSSF